VVERAELDVGNMTAIVWATAVYGSGVARRPSITAATALATLAAGCGSTSHAPPAFPGSLPAAENRLDLIAFPGYAEAGGDDPRVNWVTPFVQATGCKVHVRTVRSSTELLDVVAGGRYDGVAAFGDVTQVLTGGHEAVPLNTDLIPNYRSVYPALKRLPQNSEHGSVVGVPHGRGADLLLWRTDRVRPGPSGWSVLFGARYAGRVGLYDAAITLADAALELKRTRLSLGIHDPYELDADQFRAVVRLAAEQSARVGAYWQDLTNALADYTGGNAFVGEATPRLAALLRADQVPVQTAAPAGGTARSASWLVLARGRHPGCMYRWLDYILSPKANAASARYLGEAPATPTACRYMDCETVHGSDEAWWSRLAFWRTPQHDCHDTRGRICADWFAWSDAWDQIRSG
jgi:putative spermidine/putrescine transport system substrate-binding protein